MTRANPVRASRSNPDSPPRIAGHERCSHNSPMGTRRLFAVSAILMGLAVFAACADDETRLGPAGGLQGKQPIDRAPGGDTPPVAPTEGGTGGCKAPVVTAACPSFATNIFPELFTTAWTCAAVGCHVAGNGAAAGVDLSAATIAYTEMTTSAKAKDLTSGKQYVNPACGDTAESFIFKDVTIKHMPIKQAGNKDATPDDLAKLKAWIECGSPP